MKTHLTVRDLIQILLLNADLRDYVTFADDNDYAYPVEEDENGQIWVGDLLLYTESQKH